MATGVRWPVAPMKAAAGKLPTGPGWWYEPKWDGHRAFVRRRGDAIEIVSSTGKPRTDQWRWLIRPVLAATSRDVVLDGEVIGYTDGGRHSFQSVNNPERSHAFVVFDLLELDGESLLGRPWSDRRRLLTEVVTPSPMVIVTPVVDDADVMVRVTESQGFEGVIAKRADSTYQPGRRSPAWVKIKHRAQQEMVVGGWKAGEGGRFGTFGSLLVGVYDDDGVLQFVGAVGTGFDDRALTAMTARLRALRSDVCPFPAPPKLPGRPVLHWVRPELVVEVAFAEWTEGGGIRAPVFLGVRDDKDPRSVVRET